MPVIYYVRHGETDFNVQGRLQGRRDTVLNAHGRQQAAECGALLKALFARDHKRPEQFDYISSPLKRARETMEVVRATLGLEPLGYAIDDRLVEIAYGDWEGLTLPEIEKTSAGILSQRERDKWDFAPPGGESYRQVAARIGVWCASLVNDTVVAAHGGGVRALMALLNILSEEQATHAQVEQGVVYVFADARSRVTPDRRGRKPPALRLTDEDGNLPRSKQKRPNIVRPLGEIKDPAKSQGRDSAAPIRGLRVQPTTWSFSLPSSSSP